MWNVHKKYTTVRLLLYSAVARAHRNTTPRIAGIPKVFLSSSLGGFDAAVERVIRIENICIVAGTRKNVFNFNCFSAYNDCKL